MTVRSKTLNDLFAQLDRTYLSPRALAYPTKIYAAISVVCDIRCPYCPRQHYGAQVESRLMDVEDFRKLAPALAYAGFVGLFGLGEPFLHRDFFEILRVTKQAGAYATTSTHGMSLTPETVERLIDEGLDELEISIDAPARRLFEFLRAGADFELVVANARRLFSRKRARRVEHPRVNIAAAVSRHNVRSLPALVRLAKKIGAAQLTFADLIILDPNNKDLSVAGTKLMDKYLAKADRVARRIGQPISYFRQNPFPWVGEELRSQPVADLRVHPTRPILDCAPPIIEARDEYFGCPEAWGAAVVERDGGVKPCCYIGEIMGNAFATPLSEIENGEGKLRIRRALTCGQLPANCRDCRNLARATPTHVAQTLEVVARSARDADLSADERREIEDRLSAYRGLFSRRESFGAARV